MNFKTVRWRFDQKPRASWASLAGLRFARGLYLYLPRAILAVSFRLSQRPMATELAVPYFLTARTLDHPLPGGEERRMAGFCLPVRRGDCSYGISPVLLPVLPSQSEGRWCSTARVDWGH